MVKHALHSKGELLAKHHLNQHAFTLQCPLASSLTPLFTVCHAFPSTSSFAVDYHASARRVSSAERRKIPQQPKAPARTVITVTSIGTETTAPTERAAAVLKK